MAQPNDDIEAFLRRLDRSFERMDSETYLVNLGPNQPRAVLRVAAPVLVVQVDVGEAPAKGSAEEARVFRRLLEMNATDLVYTAFGLDGDRIVLDAALDVTTMDIGELEAVLANLDLAIAQNVPELRELVKPG